MKIWQKTYLPEILGGLAITMRHLAHNLTHRREMPVIDYPEVKRPLAPRHRSLHRLMRRPDGTPRCVACMMCATACPALCIHIEEAEHPDPRIEKRPRKFDIDLLRCVYCGLCVEACPCDAIRMDTGVIPPSEYSRGALVYDMDMLLAMNDKVNNPDALPPSGILEPTHDVRNPHRGQPEPAVREPEPRRT
jgi:NADH-quinone oxidoreductase subunit I